MGIFDDAAALKPARVPVDESKYPLSYRFLRKLATKFFVGVEMLAAVRKYPLLIKADTAEMILWAAGELLIEEVKRRIDPRGEAVDLPFEAAIDYDQPYRDVLELMIVLHRDRYERNAGWMVLIGDVWDVLGGFEDDKSDPFATWPPDYEQMEVRLQSLIGKVMASIPVEMYVQYLSEAKN